MNCWALWRAEVPVTQIHRNQKNRSSHLLRSLCRSAASAQPWGWEEARVVATRLRLLRHRLEVAEVADFLHRHHRLLGDSRLRRLPHSPLLSLPRQQAQRPP
jgi:hypothetical protein